jgi:hypothetical protein
MRRIVVILTAIFLSSDFWLLTCWPQSLSTFADFQRIDRRRRRTGELQNAELVEAMRVDSKLVTKTAQDHPHDTQVLWGAAETLVDWPSRRALYEAAIRVGGTNTAMVLRFACAAAYNRDFEVALPWLRICQQRDKKNALPSLAEFWIQRERAGSHSNAPLPKFAGAPAQMEIQYRDYAADAARAHIRLLEEIGYSKYTARRLGFIPATDVLWMMRDLASVPDANARAILLAAARSMQQSSTFMVNELVGQTVERTVLATRADSSQDSKVNRRVLEMETRRDELKALLEHVQRDVVDTANETEMVRYFDDVLTEGEEAAMKDLAKTIRRSD